MNMKLNERLTAEQAIHALKNESGLTVEIETIISGNMVMFSITKTETVRVLKSLLKSGEVDKKEKLDIFVVRQGDGYCMII